MRRHPKSNRRRMCAPKSRVPTHYFSYEEIERVCERELARAGLLPDRPSPIKIDKYLETYFGAIVEFSELPSNILGKTHFHLSGPRVEIQQALYESNRRSDHHRLRSTYAHETGHILFQQVPVFLQSGVFGGDIVTVCRESTSEAETSGAWDRAEVQANSAIGALLIPTGLGRQLVEANFALDRLRFEWEDALALVARAFDTSFSVARYRLKKLYPDHALRF